MTNQLILFDGDCGFCNSTMRYIAERDVKEHFKFVASTSRMGTELLQKYDLVGAEKHTLIVAIGDQVFTESQAFVQITKQLPYHQWLSVLMALCPPLSNQLYRLVSRVRRQLPASSNCSIPSEEIRKKFVFQ